MSRTPLVAIFRKALRKAVSDTPDIGRRNVLKGAALIGATAIAPWWLSGCKKPTDILSPSARVAVVGAGIAGLHAAWILNHRGLDVNVYEGSKRTGGRMMSAHNLVAEGSITELGGEYIDSNHSDMLSLANHFGLKLIDLEDEAFSGKSEVYSFGGVKYNDEDIVKAILPHIAKLEADIAILPPNLATIGKTSARRFDELSMERYFDEVGFDGWFRQFLDCAFVTENGLELSEQSALNFLTLVSTDLTSGSFSQFGSSDERFKIRGGNQQIPDLLAEDLGGRIVTDMMLKRLARNGSVYTLTFNGPGGEEHVEADYVVLAIPLTMLRKVQIDVELSPLRQRMISELAYGMNMKVIVGFDKPFWHETNDNGFIYASSPLQLVWDNTALQGVQGGGLTFYSGGDNCRKMLGVSAQVAAAELLKELENVWPLVASANVTKITSMNWPQQQYVRASYSCYAPGQWSLFYGREMESEGNIYFAGEHCSADFKGYMNGGAETGRVAAERILQSVTA